MENINVSGSGVYGIFESTHITGRNFSFISDVDLENGMLVHKGELVDATKEVYRAIIPTAATIANEPVFVIGNPAWNYDTSSIVNQNECKYFIPAGKVFRVYCLNTNDKFGVADYGITGDPVVGEYVGLAPDSARPVASATRPTGAFVGQVVQIVDMGYDYFVGVDVNQRTHKVRIEVVRNG